MKQVIEYMEKLVEDMKDMLHWGIEGIVEVQELTEGDKVFGVIVGDVTRYTKQDDEFIWQKVGYCGDDYSGFILKPLEGKKYLKVSFEC